jgi:glycosyltransferase involved in cell wall biosynthesis
MIKNDHPTHLKVLLLTHEYGRHIEGGVGRVVNGIFNKISTDVILDVCLIKWPLFSGMNLAYVYRRNEQNKIKNLYSGELKIIFTLALEREKYDLIHIVVNSPFTSECIKIAKMYFPKVKCIYSCHSIAKHEIKVRKNNEGELTSEAYIMDHADHIQVLNKASLQYLKNSYLESTEKTQKSIIPNGIDETDFATINQQFQDVILKKINRERDILIVCLSRWSFGKGIEYLIDAIPEVTKKIKNVKFIIAGRKTESWENQVEKYVEVIDKKIENVSEYVISLGWLDNQSRNTVFSMADICVMPSLLEYFPYGILEPMACKVPIIASNIDSVTELIEEGKECLLFSPANSKELAEKIIYLIENKQKMHEFKQNAYQKIKDKYNWESITSQYVSMYQSLVE